MRVDIVIASGTEFSKSHVSIGQRKTAILDSLVCVDCNLKLEFQVGSRFGEEASSQKRMKLK